MLIFDENIRPFIFEDIFTPTLIEYFYTLNIDIMDFTLSPLLALEEVISPALLIELNGFQFHLPASYHILIYSDETSQLDTIKVSELINSEFQIFTYNGKENKIIHSNYKFIDYKPTYKFVIPFINKEQFFCHPVSEHTWINITPHDQFKKIEGKVIGDLL